jgi:hypothetical protein
VNSKIYCDPRKAAILKCEKDAELDALLTSDPKDSIVHLVPLATLTSDRLKIYAERLQGTFDRIIGFRPTGWTYVCQTMHISARVNVMLDIHRLQELIYHPRLPQYCRKHPNEISLPLISGCPQSRHLEFTFIQSPIQNIHPSMN